MPRPVLVLVEPQHEGNVGAVARVLANFGLEELVLVRPCSLGEEAYRRAKHARQLLHKARRADTLEEALDSVDLAVGSTAVPTAREDAFHRHAVPPWELAERVGSRDGRVALVLGREDYGLLNEELDRMDLLVHIPCHPSYPVMNVSHAAGVLLYELLREPNSAPTSRRRLASGFEKEKLHEAFHEFLVATGYPAHKRRRTEVMFRRLVGRALPTKWEFHAIMGAFRHATKGFWRLTGEGPPEPKADRPPR